MKNTEQLIKLENKAKIVDIKISQLEKRIALKNNIKRNKENKLKKRLARIFLASKFFDIIEKTNFSMHEIYTIGGLIMLNQLDKQKSSVLIASYNCIIEKVLKDNLYKNELFKLGQERYIEDRKIRQDIQPTLQLIHAILIKVKEFIENSNIEDLQIQGDKYFKIRKDIKIQKQVDKVLKSLYKSIL